MEPDLLLLDEPTNHLDLESLLWFQEYLRNYPGAMLLISHDREFMEQLVGSIIEIAQAKTDALSRQLGQLRRAESGARRAAARRLQEPAEGDRALQEFADRFRAKASKASQAQSKLKQIERMEKIEAPTAQEKTVQFRFPQPPRSGQRVITLEDVRPGYDEGVIAD